MAAGLRIDPEKIEQADAKRQLKVLVDGQCVEASHRLQVIGLGAFPGRTIAIDPQRADRHIDPRRVDPDEALESLARIGRELRGCIRGRGKRERGRQG